jgi:hypothetical protein
MLRLPPQRTRCESQQPQTMFGSPPQPGFREGLCCGELANCNIPAADNVVARQPNGLSPENTLGHMKKPPLPAEEMEDDWRLHAVARLAEDWTSPWSGQTAPKGSRLTVSSVIQLTKKKQTTIPLPNATALLLSASARAYTAARLLREESEIDKSLYSQVAFGSDEQVFDYIERMMEAAILAFTAIEAFVNEVIPDDYMYARPGKSEVILEPASKAAIERYVQIDEKLTAVLPEICKCSSPKGSRCWQSYRQLKNVRDRLVHMKSEDRKSSGPEVDTIWRAVFLLRAPHLTAKGVIDHFAKAMPNPPGWYAKFPLANA